MKYLKKCGVREASALLLAIAACAALVLYFQSHPLALSGLMEVTLMDVAIINLLYIASVFTLAIILCELTRLSSKKLPVYESWLVTSYSTLVNYIVPGQTGPGVRALYLYARHGVPVRIVMIGTMVYLIWLVIISVGMVLYALCADDARELFLLLVAMMVIVLSSVYSIRKNSLPQMESKFMVYPRMVLLTGVLTLIQVVLIAGAYYVELTAIDPSISIVQSVTYSGVANLSLLVAITPGAIGIREAFLLVSQNVHNISTETIAAASALDRASYVLLLVELGIFIFFSHAGKQFSSIE